MDKNFSHIAQAIASRIKAGEYIFSIADIDVEYIDDCVELQGSDGRHGSSLSIPGESIDMLVDIALMEFNGNFQTDNF